MSKTLSYIHLLVIQIFFLPDVYNK